MSTVFEGCGVASVDEYFENLELNLFEKVLIPVPTLRKDVECFVSVCKECNIYEKALIPVPTCRGNEDKKKWERHRFHVALNNENEKHYHEPSKRAPRGCGIPWVDEYFENLMLNHFVKTLVPVPALRKDVECCVSACKECNLSEKARIPVPNEDQDSRYWFHEQLRFEYMKHLHKSAKKAPNDLSESCLECAQNSANNKVCNAWKEEGTLQAAGKALMSYIEKANLCGCEEDLNNRLIFSAVATLFEAEAESETESESGSESESDRDLDLDLNLISNWT